MSTVDASATPAQEAAAAPTGPLAGDPSLIGLPVFIVGSIALGLSLVGYIPAGVLGAPLAIILLANGLGLFIAAIWAAALGQSAVASIFAIFTSFWWSYAALVLGVLHNWFGLAATDVVPTVKLFLLSWLILVVVLTLGTLRLPSAFTLLFVLVDLALLLLLLAYSASTPSTGLIKTAGYVIFAFALVGIYLFLGALGVGTGGKALPVGRPILR